MSRESFLARLRASWYGSAAAVVALLAMLFLPTSRYCIYSAGVGYPVGGGASCSFAPLLAVETPEAIAAIVLFLLGVSVATLYWPRPSILFLTGALTVVSLLTISFEPLGLINQPLMAPFLRHYFEIRNGLVGAFGYPLPILLLIPSGVLWMGAGFTGFARVGLRALSGSPAASGC